MSVKVSASLCNSETPLGANDLKGRGPGASFLGIGLFGGCERVKETFRGGLAHWISVSPDDFLNKSDHNSVKITSLALCIGECYSMDCS